MVHRAEPDVREVLNWLQRQISVHVALVAGNTATMEASTLGFPREVLRPLAPLLVRLSSGQTAAAAIQVDKLHVRCEVLGVCGTRPVLVVAADREVLSPQEAALASHTGSVIALLRRDRDADRISRGYQYKARQLRFAVLSALMVGDPSLARRMTTGAVPPLLDADQVRVYLLHCSQTDRDRITQAHQDSSGYHGPDLMVQCPAFKTHLICLIADDSQTDADSTPGHGKVLRRLVHDNPHYALGISGPHALSATAQAYSQAAHALAAARTTPGRVALYHGQTPLADLLPPRPALLWARAFLRPLDSLPKVTVDITHLAMSVPRSAVASLLDLSRNTVTAHIRRAERALGVDLSDVRCRAAVTLALTLTGSTSLPEPAEHQVLPTLDDLLRTDSAAAWAQAFLHPLQAPHRRTLHAWINANADAQRAASRIGISRNTVRTHLRTVEALLSRDLLTTGSGIHDVVHALHITTSKVGGRSSFAGESGQGVEAYRGQPGRAG
ncbi:helix-turn-helix domain-containing protein [Nonomuraea deserti]|nr:helix-turn-helix domain-containing protein [Nonomuraea deserti]